MNSRYCPNQQSVNDQTPEDKNGLDYGFVITDHRLVWYYGEKGRQSLELEDIMDANVGKAILATVFRPIDFDNVQYPEVYLDGIREMDTFIVKFNKFIDEIYYTFNGEELGGTEENSIEDLLDYACHVVKVGDTYCIVGNPTIPYTDKKYNLAKRNFNIPNEDSLFLIYDSTVLGTCTKGFAISTSGFYYYNTRRGYLNWEDFSKQNITYSFMGLKIAGEVFNMGLDGKNISIILNTISEYLR